MESYGITIAGTGSYVPDQILTNHDLEKMVDTSDEWIQTRTGISERHIAGPEQATSDLGAEAGKRALENAGMSADEIDLIIVATLSPDTPFPNTACHVQRKLEATNAACFSMEAACSGFLYALEVGSNMLRGGNYRNALIIGAEKMSTYVDWEDRNTCVLFGDGAGAAVLKRVDAKDDSVLACHLGADGRFTDLLHVPAGGSAMPLTHEIIDERQQYIKMNGREIFKLAVNAMVDACNTVLDKAGVTIDQVRWLVPHQANTRIILGVGKRLNIENERVFMNLSHYGNTSAATIPLCLDEIARGGQVKSGDYVLLTAFGGGLTWGSLLLRWP